jgi:hypothetical protein
VRLLALGPDADCETDVRKAIKQFAPDVIGVSVRNIDDQNMQSPHFLLGSLKQVVAVCRAASSSRIVLGGAGYSIFPESALAYLGGDMGRLTTVFEMLGKSKYFVGSAPTNGSRWRLPAPRRLSDDPLRRRPGVLRPRHPMGWLYHPTKSVNRPEFAHITSGDTM